MPLSIPDETRRWRCGACGNLTRFDVTRTRRTTEYWHVDLAGGPAVEETVVERETVERVACRWCGRDDAVELVARAEADPTTDPGEQDPGGRGPGGRGPGRPSGDAHV